MGTWSNGTATTGDDVYRGDSGVDVVDGLAGDDTLSGLDGQDMLSGGTGDDLLYGGGDNDVLNGGDGNDILDVGYIPGSDQAHGGGGDDTLVLNYSNVVFDNGQNTPIAVTLNASSGTFVTQIQGFSSVSATSIEAVQFYGPDGDDTITGGTGDDHLVGAGGSDTLRGGAGDDYLQIDLRPAADGDVDKVYGDAGIDTLGLRFSGSGAVAATDDWIVSAGVAPTRNGVAVGTVVGMEAFDVYLTGRSAVITGGAHADKAQVYVTGGAATLNMGGGDDVVIAATSESNLLTIDTGAGNDTISAAAETGSISAGAGNDTIVAHFTRKGVIDAGAGDDVISTGSGFLFNNTVLTDRVYDGGAGHDLVYGTTISGYTFRNVERLSWSLQVEMRIAQFDQFQVIGGGDNDGPFIAIVGVGGVLDLTNRSVNGTRDLYINSYASTQSGGRSVGLDFTGRALKDIINGAHGADDILRGMAGDDTLNGDWTGYGALKAGNDQLFGGAGNDTLLGQLGNDILDGGVGADRMEGGEGNDIYYVDNVGDVIVEAVGAGTDRVNTTINFNAAGLDIENIAITGTGRINIVGNDLDNVMQGNDDVNALNGGRGADRMAGGGGNDLYYVDNVGDVVIERAGEGTDTVRSAVTHTLGANVERLQLVGSQQINAIGNAMDNVITGNARSNVIVGMGGRDLMTGGGGADRFDFRLVSDSPFAAYDRITDLEDQDVINLSAIDANTNVAGDQAFALVSAFTGQAGQMTLTYVASSNFTVLSADVNGDRVGDFRVILDGDHRDYDNFRP